MKKYILLIGLLCYAFLPSMAEGKSTVYQDSTTQKRKDHFGSFQAMPSEEIEKFRSMAEDFAEQAAKFKDTFPTDFGKEFAELNFDKQFADLDFGEGLANMAENSKEFNFFFQNKENKNPTRIEKKSFSNISEIEIDHKYGNIIVKESGSKQVDLEIQYFDSNNKAGCDISVSKGILSIVTISEGRNSSSGRQNAKINYIITVPRNTGISVNLKYGNMKMDNHRGAFAANISYGNLDVESFSDVTPTLNIKYGNLKVASAQDISLKTSYSNMKIGKAKKIQLSGTYSNYEIDDIEFLDTDENYSYGDFKIKSIHTMKANVKFANIAINNLISDMTVKASYSDIIIKNLSFKFKNIDIDGAYSDVTVFLPENLSTSISANLLFGDLDISKKHSVNYSQQSNENHRIKKTGVIGKNPKASIKVINQYADVRIK